MYTEVIEDGGLYIGWKGLFCTEVYGLGRDKYVRFGVENHLLLRYTSLVFASEFCNVNTLFHAVCDKVQRNQPIPVALKAVSY